MRTLQVTVVVIALCALAVVANAFWGRRADTGRSAARRRSDYRHAGCAGECSGVEGAGPAIVLIHGFGAAIDWWDKIAPELATNYRVIRIDLSSLGHGGTAAPRSAGYSIERQAMLVSAILDQMGVERFTVIGHSMGGEVATALAAMQSAAGRPYDPHRQSGHAQQRATLAS